MKLIAYYLQPVDHTVLLKMFFDQLSFHYAQCIGNYNEPGLQHIVHVIYRQPQSI